MTDTLRLRSDIAVRLVQQVGSDASVIAAARVSVEGVASYSLLHEPPEDHKGLIRFLMRQKHGTPFEHASLTFLVEAPIFVFRQWQRHRIGWSYSETSGRYRELEPVFWVPRPGRKLKEAPKFRPSTPAFVPGTPADAEAVRFALRQSYVTAWKQYQDLVECGIAKEVARAALSGGLYSSMYVTCNPRSLMAFLSLRTYDANARHVSYPQAEIEDAARQMEAEFARLFPLTHAAYVEFGRVAP